MLSETADPQNFFRLSLFPPAYDGWFLSVIRLSREWARSWNKKEHQAAHNGLGLVKAPPKTEVFENRVSNNSINSWRYEKTNFTEAQIVKILGEQEQGKSMSDICREHGISQPTFYCWKSKFSGIDVHQLKRIKELQAELSQYKKIVAEQTLSITVLKDVIENSFKAWWKAWARPVY